MKCGHSSLTEGCRPCRELKKKWDVKLEKEGVNNIERADGGLKYWHSFMFVTKKSQRYSQDAKAEYYRMAGHFLHDHKFDNLRDRLIWELHANGEKAVEIVPKLSKQRFKVDLNTVYQTIKRLVKEMMELCNQ